MLSTVEPVGSYTDWGCSLIRFLSMFSLSLNSRPLSVKDDDLKEADRQGLKKVALS